MICKYCNKNETISSTIRICTECDSETSRILDKRNRELNPSSCHQANQIFGVAKYDKKGQKTMNKEQAIQNLVGIFSWAQRAEEECEYGGTGAKGTQSPRQWARNKAMEFYLNNRGLRSCWQEILADVEKELVERKLKSMYQNFCDDPEQANLRAEITYWDEEFKQHQLFWAQAEEEVMDTESDYRISQRSHFKTVRMKRLGELQYLVDQVTFGILDTNTARGEVLSALSWCKTELKKLNQKKSAHTYTGLAGFHNECLVMLMDLGLKVSQHRFMVNRKTGEVWAHQMPDTVSPMSEVTVDDNEFQLSKLAF